jgi:hypothetical protein
MSDEWKVDIEAALRTLNRALARLPEGAGLEADADGRRVIVQVETDEEIWHCSGS